MDDKKRSIYFEILVVKKAVKLSIPILWVYQSTGKAPAMGEQCC